MIARFRNRSEAGQILGGRLADYAGRPDVLVLALPRGGVPVAFEVAQALAAPLDVFIVRKLGVPGYQELAMGAIAEGGELVLNDDVVTALNLTSHVIHAAAARERHELERRERVYRGDRPAPRIRDRVVILVDDGIATGATIRAAIKAIHQREPARLIVAVPTASLRTADEIRPLVDDFICDITPEPFYAVGVWYEDFSQTTDDEVRDLLDRAAVETRAAS
jgi:predicted phosphoribosyltransferase